jgi:peptidyl-prolyl cis-trans isomerase A (cyclophilin A)
LLLPLLTGCGDSKPGPEAVKVQAPTETPVKAKPDTKPKTPAVAVAQEPLPENLQKLMDPSQFDATAPDTFKVKFETTVGSFVVQVHRDWAPHGADRFFNLVTAGWFTDVAFFRVIDGFMAQFGLHGEPRVMKAWRDAKIPDDENTGHSNTRGMLTFATSGPNTRTTQLFISFKNNANLDRQGFTPIGEITEGMDVVDKLYNGYGEGAPRGRGPSQGKIQKSGNVYLKGKFPELTYATSATIIR